MTHSPRDSTLTNRSLLIGVIIGCLLLLLPNGVQAAPHVLVVLSRDGSVYRQVADSLESQLKAQQPLIGIKRGLVGSPDLASQVEGAGLLIAVGAGAMASVLPATSGKPLFGALIPQSSFEHLANETPASRQRLQAGMLSALYFDQPFERQLLLLTLIKPQSRNLGVLFGPTSRTRIDALKRAAETQRLGVVHALLKEGDNPIKVLTPIIAQSDAFLAIPDQAVFNRTTAKWILYMTQRYRIPLIGFSKRYVDAGALAAVYSTPEQVGRETGELLKDWLGGVEAELPVPRYPLQFSVSINRAVLHSLGLPPQDALQLERRIREGERE